MEYPEHKDNLDAFFRAIDERYRQLKTETEATDLKFYRVMRERMASYPDIGHIPIGRLYSTP